jgi:hypothetical protein
MTPEDFSSWVAEMLRRELAVSEAHCGRLLGVSANSIVTMKKEGVRGPSATRTALACAALIAGLAPFKARQPSFSK